MAGSAICPHLVRDLGVSDPQGLRSKEETKAGKGTERQKRILGVGVGGKPPGNPGKRL